MKNLGARTCLLVWAFWPLTDERLVWRMMEGNGDPFRRELAAFLPRLRRAARSKARYFLNPGETADDAVQDTCLRALERAYQFRGDNFAAYILTILDSRLADEGRSRESYVIADPSEVDALADKADPTISDPLTQMITREQWGRLRRAVTEPQWQVAVLVIMLEYTYREAAIALEIPHGTVMSRMHKVRLKIEELFG